MKIFLMSTLLFLTISEVMAQNLVLPSSNISCQELGYNTVTDDCIQQGGVPLLCPFNNKDNNLCLCMNKSCRGYYLTDADLDVLASDGKKVRDHVASLNECKIGFGNDAVVLYQINECKEGSLYQNDICDVGCDTVGRYPYNYHPGNLAGKVVSCIDERGEWFGYTECKDGWYGGWNDTTYRTGYCKLNDCNIHNYPYTTNPNIKENRGTLQTCKIGGNTYYRYSACDDNFQLRGNICVKFCKIKNCSNIETEVKQNGYTWVYNDWKCSFEQSNCKVGDIAITESGEVGVIADISADRTILIWPEVDIEQWHFAAGDAISTNIPELTDGDYNTWGKIQTKGIMSFKTRSGYRYPAAEKVQSYMPDGCDHEVCQSGEWYLPNYAEALTVSQNLNILVNSLQYSSWILEPAQSANESSDGYFYTFDFSTGIKSYSAKGQSAIVVPFLAF